MDTTFKQLQCTPLVRKRGIRMRILRRLSVASVAFVMATSAFADGSVILPLANVTASCLNVNKKTVDFWILSARVPTDANWFRSTNGVGVQVDVTLSGTGQKASFPAAATIDTRDLGGRIVRASLGLHVLADQELWNIKNASTPIRTSNISVPLTFVRRQGKSDTVKVFQALLNFTKSASELIPPNPYVQGAELVGQLTNSIATVFAADANDAVDPSFSLAFSVSRVDGGCSVKDLHDNVGVEISDSDVGDESQGIIKTSSIANYCFYKIGQDADPNVGFVRKGASACPIAVPANVAILANPQFIWLASGKCKDDASCDSTPAPSLATITRLKDVLLNKPEVFALVGRRLGAQGASSLKSVLSKQVLDVAALGRGKAVFNAISMCRSVGISEERCLDRKFAEAKP
ncbi:hypothetical protein [Burkholderia reimsis]|uniref:hypothetical protein n=1 Tax=Burkholderia reimsis TaxID=2234132 RepID=UPI00105896DD|nr:hypothetical protein [Burkholderia reimsis]